MRVKFEAEKIKQYIVINFQSNKNISLYSGAWRYNISLCSVSMKYNDLFIHSSLWDSLEAAARATYF